MNCDRLAIGVSHRKNPYEIESELKVRKKLESATNHMFEFKRNDDYYKEDIECYLYQITGNDWNRYIIGYVEVEEKPQWKKSTWPNYYTHYNFLARKVNKYDYQSKLFTHELVDNANSTIYLCTAIDLSDAFCCLVSDIPKFGKFWNRSSNENYHNRYDCYYRIDKDHHRVYRGWENVVPFITTFLKCNS